MDIFIVAARGRVTFGKFSTGEPEVTAPIESACGAFFQDQFTRLGIKTLEVPGSFELILDGTDFLYFHHFKIHFLILIDEEFSGPQFLLCHQGIANQEQQQCEEGGGESGSFHSCVLCVFTDRVQPRYQFHILPIFFFKIIPNASPGLASHPVSPILVIHLPNSMKAILLLCALCLTQTLLLAQGTYLEDFENGMPADYHLVNLDGLTPDNPGLVNLTDSAWTTRNVTAQGWPHGNSAFSVSWYQNDTGPSNDWMVTPAIAIGANALLSWDAMAITSSGDYRDRYQVYIGTDTAIASYAALTPVYDTGDTGEVAVPVSRMIDLAANGFQNQSIHIAFRNFTEPFNSNEPIGPGNGGNELAIDNIQVTDVVAVSEALAQNFQSLAISPNPARDHVQLHFELAHPTELTLQIYDIQGQEIQSLELGRFGRGKQEKELHLTALAPGNYLLHFRGEGTYATQKLILHR